MEPNLSSQVAIAMQSLTILGAKLNVSNEVKPLLDRTVNEQVAALQARVRDDPFLEVAARGEWNQDVPFDRARRRQRLACRICGWRFARPARLPRSLASTNPRSCSPSGVQAETASCPMRPNQTVVPGAAELVPQAEQGRVNIAVPIDVPSPK